MSPLVCEREHAIPLVDAGTQDGGSLRRACCPLCGATSVLPVSMVAVQERPVGPPIVVWATAR